ncbi:carbohydrate ABC transporter permease [Tenggerimyces flavus]|uniref:Carbohydrate ABC transporter permease n=1 Tax=Tenggerimyces flavus TaxID=1708749 RepID=A0ABV7YAV8_9ACTN|nr:sugar ABC transporter permease [Tenggerimyces flavus]MBM7783713.1 multiple sugar transport system permease protein [Tenggerimyces flavus]
MAAQVASRRTVVGWLFIGPVIAGVVAFQFVPVVVSVYASLTDWSGLSAPRFAGIANYLELFTKDPLFYLTLRNTAVFTLGSVVLSVGFGLVLALLGNEKLPGIGIFKAAFFAPVVTNSVAVGFVWFWLYQPENGLINGFLAQANIEGPTWLTSNSWAMIAVIIVAVWQGVGYPMLILLAGLQSIPDSLHEAARIDGASAWSRFWRVTLPLLTPSLFFLTIMQFITSFQIFGIIFVMTHGGPANATNVYIYQVYQSAFSFGRLGYAAAMGWILFVIVGLVTFLQWRLEKRWVFYGE